MSQRAAPNAERDRLQRGRIRRSVFLPFGLMLLLLALILGVAFSLRTAAQVAVVSDMMLTALALCTLVICLFPIVVLTLTLAALMGRLQGLSRSPLRRLESWTAAVERRADKWLGRIDQRALQWAVNLAPVRQLLGIFDRPSYDSQDEGGEDE